MSGRMVIVGAGLAGQSASLTMRAAGHAGPISLIGKESLPAYERPQLSKAMLASEAAPSPSFVIDSGTLAALDLDLQLSCSVQAIHSEAREILLSNGRSLSYDKLLLATGATPRALHVPGGERALPLRNFDDACTLHVRLAPETRVCIIGGGFIGMELAAAARQRGCLVTVIEAGPRILMRGVPEAISKRLHARHVAAGVEIRTSCALAAIDEEGVVLADGTRIPSQTIIAGIGVAPEMELARAAGLVTGNGIVTDATLRTSDPHIYAAGDCCLFPHELFNGTQMRLESWRNAQNQGSLAGENMLGADKPCKVVPWLWSDQYEITIQIAGLPDAAQPFIFREPSPGTLIAFQLGRDGRLQSASGIGEGNSIARDIKLAEMLIAKSAKPQPEQLMDAAIPLKRLLSAGG